MVSPIIDEVELIKSVLSQKDVPVDTLRSIFNSNPEQRILEIIAGHPQTPNDILVKLLDSTDISTRKTALLNPNLDYTIAFEAIKKYKAWALIKNIAEREDVPSKAISNMFKPLVEENVNYVVHLGIAETPKLSSELIDKIAAGSVTSHRSLISQKNITEEILEKLWEVHGYVGLLGHKGIANEYSNAVARELLAHPKFPVKILLEVLKQKRISNETFMLLPNIKQRVYTHLQTTVA